MRVLRTRQCGESGFATNQKMGMGLGEEDGGPLIGVPWLAVGDGWIEVGVLTQWQPGHMVDLGLQERRRQQGGETEDRLNHQHKHGEEHQHARVRVHP
jgi:hypothetical protein